LTEERYINFSTPSNTEQARVIIATALPKTGFDASGIPYAATAAKHERQKQDTNSKRARAKSGPQLIAHPGG
jgi:hypothetical protein